MVGQAGDHTLPEHLLHRILDHGARVLVHDGEHRGEGALKGIFEAPAGEPLGHGIHRRYRAMSISRDDAVPDARQRVAETNAFMPDRSGVRTEMRREDAGDQEGKKARNSVEVEDGPEGPEQGKLARHGGQDAGEDPEPESSVPSRHNDRHGEEQVTAPEQGRPPGRDDDSNHHTHRGEEPSQNEISSVADRDPHSSNAGRSGNPISAPQRRWRFAGSALQTRSGKASLGWAGRWRTTWPFYTRRAATRMRRTSPGGHRAGGPRVVSSSTRRWLSSAAWILPET